MLEHAGEEVRFLGGTSCQPDPNGRGEKAVRPGASDTPLNSLVEKLLSSWFHARFVERFGHGGAVLDERHFTPMEHPPDLEKDPHLAQLDVKVLARKLADHSAILALFENKLAEDWSEREFSGDRPLEAATTTAFK